MELKLLPLYPNLAQAAQKVLGLTPDEAADLPEMCHLLCTSLGDDKHWPTWVDAEMLGDLLVVDAMACGIASTTYERYRYLCAGQRWLYFRYLEQHYSMTVPTLVERWQEEGNDIHLLPEPMDAPWYSERVVFTYSNEQLAVLDRFLVYMFGKLALGE
jgi:hypothetical protein